MILVGPEDEPAYLVLPQAAGLKAIELRVFELPIKNKLEGELKNLDVALRKVKEALEAERAVNANGGRSKGELDHEIDMRQEDLHVLSAKKNALTLENSKVQGEVMRLGAEKGKAVGDVKTAEKKVSDFSGSRVKTSAQQYAPGTPRASKPSCRPGCQTPKTTPLGSRAIAIVPKSPTCIGSISTSPPSARIFWAVAAASGDARYRHQADWPSWPGIGGTTAATALPFA